ncbi:Ig-like domain-containing protein [Persicirhabdus sediminis]|uniref:Cadherin-like domain-containing protein n=1 Tax=Persicirhabdus sediminis TaxID=454144 RepID=A0A8J7MFX8_9BACT|nr:Ig-like domain-containing protein [Persicirhabdus sediminis]MBK1792061.1 cadherin-like domain-containing protein [Persicirhabdus sediminis]
MEKHNDANILRAGRPLSQLRTIVGSAIILANSVAFGQISYFEDFNKAGQPSAPNGLRWTFTDQMLPGRTWNDFVPGDGYAHITFDADSSNDTPGKSQPFQDIAVKSVGPGHRLEMCAKGAAVVGVGGFIFTYIEDYPYSGPYTGVDEIDIEVVPVDTRGTDTPNHPILPSENGWTDARFNTWANSDPDDGFKPVKSIKTSIVDIDGNRVSHMDDEFHVYTIEWQNYPDGPTGDGRDGLVVFYIDGVRQATITYPVPESPANLIYGVRQMPSWTGNLDFEGTKTMLIDWISIEPIDDDSPNAITDSYDVAGGIVVGASKGVLSNDIGDNLQAKLINPPKYGTLQLNADGSFTYTAMGGFTGRDQFIYNATNGKATGTTNSAVVTLNVTDTVGVGAVDDVYSVKANGVLEVDFPGVLENDHGVGLSVTGNTKTSNGILNISPEGGFKYTPNYGFSGEDSFSYTITGGENNSDTATVKILVSEGSSSTVESYAYYQLNETSGTLAADSSGNNRHATVVNRNWTDGKYGGGMAFTNTSQLLIDRNNISSNWSFSAWVKASNNFSQHEYLAYSPTHTLNLRNWDKGNIAYGEKNKTDYEFTTALTRNQWQHLTFTGSGKTVTLYVNGENKGSIQTSGTSMMPMTSIGNGTDGESFGMINSIVDEIGIYNKTLTADEVKTIFENTKPSLIDDWKNQHFTSSDLQDPNVSGNFATPRGDGLANVLKYALGLDPKSHHKQAFSMDLGGNKKPVIGFNYDPQRSDVDIILETSSDLKSWQTAGQSVQGSAFAPVNGKATVIHNNRELSPNIQLELNDTAESKNFVRIRVDANEE